MVDRKGIGWVPDYPDIRDYDVNEIDSKLKPKLEDTQISNDSQGILTPSIVDGLLGLLDQVESISESIPSQDNTVNKELSQEKNIDQSSYPKNLTRAIDEIKKKISGNFKFVRAKSVQKEQTFLALGNLSYKVYDFQQKLLALYEYMKSFRASKDVNDLMKSLQCLKEAFEINEPIDKNRYIECGYFGEITRKALKEFKKTFIKSSEYSIIDIIDTVTIEKINQILEKLESLKHDSNEIKKSLAQIIESLTKDSNKKHNYPILKDDKSLPLLRMKDGGENVKYLQELLSQIEEFNFEPTEYFGLSTQQAVINFQIKYKLLVDGIVGPQTWRILHELVKLKIQQLQRSAISHTSPIPIQLYEIILKIFQISDFSKIKELTEFSAEELVREQEVSSETDTIKDKQELKQTIDLIVQIVAQILSPLAQHRNLEKAVIDVLQQIDQWFNKSDEINCFHTQKLQRNQSEYNSTENIEAIIKYVFWEFQKQSSPDNVTSNTRKIEQKNDLFKEWDSNPVSFYLNVSTILNFKQALKNIPNTINDVYNKDRASKFVEKSINKIDDIFKSIKYLEPNDLLKQLSDNLQSNKEDNQQSQTNEENSQKIQQQTLRTIIKFTPDNLSKELEKQPDFQGDLQLPIEWNLHKTIQAKGKATTYVLMPEFVDLSFWCSPIEDQGSIDSCTAHAGVALMEYFEKRSFDRYIDASPLFLYKVTRNLMHRQGDAGASLRETMKAMALFGVPPEEYWPYEEDKFDEEPTPFCYSFAQSYQALKYFRLNPVGTISDILLVRIKTALAAGLPCAFGFTVYNSIDDDSNPKGHIPYPVKTDKVKGGHAVVAVGYDDHKLIEDTDGKVSRGALLIRNSWGTNWGEGGYGWLPYEYILEGLTDDWWSLLKSEWFETGKFGLGATDKGSNLGIETRTTPPPPPPPPD